jgi:hypothetical protein
MTSAELIRKKIEEIPAGQPFTPAEFLGIAARSSVDKTLARMHALGVLAKPSRGVFVRPKQSKYGAIPPEPFEVALAKANGAPVEIHGAEAARRFGLSTQAPVRPVYYTTGRSKTFKLGSTTVELQHVSPRKLIAPGTKVGLVVSALWYLGKEQVTPEVLSVVRSKLTPEEYAALKEAAPKMPSWMADALHRFEKKQANA